MQNLTEGNLYLNMTFEVVDGNLTVKAEINDDEYTPKAFLALQFDSDNNGTIDIRYWAEYDDYNYNFRYDDSQFLLYANNQTRCSLDEDYWGWLPDGRTYIVTGTYGAYDEESSFHAATFNQTSRVYTFLFTFPIQPTTFNLEEGTYNNWLNGVHGIEGKLVRVAFGIKGTAGWPDKGKAVYVPPFKFME